MERHYVINVDPQLTREAGLPIPTMRVRTESEMHLAVVYNAVRRLVCGPLGLHYKAQQLDVNRMVSSRFFVLRNGVMPLNAIAGLCMVCKYPMEGVDDGVRGA